MLGAVPKEDVLAKRGRDALNRLLPGKRIVNVVCDRCQALLGVVKDTEEGPWFALWVPTFSVRPTGPSGPPLWAVAAGVLPEEEVTVHCFQCGHRVVDDATLVAAVEKYRARGRPQRVAAVLPSP
jgi:hypothetical protein